MIGLIQNRTEFDYDIRSLILAFYHGEKIAASEEGAEFLVRVAYRESSMRISLEQDGRTALWEDVPLEGEGADAFQDEDRKKSNRNNAKKALYRLMTQWTGRELPWGTMTGVRPTKIGMALYENGLDERAAEQIYRERYLVSGAKARLCARVAKKEYELLSALEPEREYSLYVGIPFCPSRCLYCSFPSNSIKTHADAVDPYLDALMREMDGAAEDCAGRTLTAVYIGGGTPTALSAGQLDRLLSGLAARFDLAKARELTVEAGRPDSLDEEKLRVLKQYPVSRISINPQTMNERTLRLIGREHDVRDVTRIYEKAREMGFDNINMDMIIGLPGEDITHVARTADQISELAPDSLTVHSLALKRASELKINLDQYRHLVRDGTGAMLDLVDDSAARMGMEPYYLYRQKNISGNLENVGYSRPGRECLYNILIMEEKQDIIALGAGATSKFVFPRENRLERAENVRDVRQYISRIDEMIERKREVCHG